MTSIPEKDQLRNYKISLFAGSIAIVVMGLDIIWNNKLDLPIFIGLVFGLIGLTISFWHYIGASKETRDERMLRVGTYATTLAWFCTMILIGCATIIANYTGIQYSGVQAMGFALSVGIGCMLVWLAYYSTKSDVDLLDSA